MDRRTIKPVPSGVHTVPGNQCIAYAQDGVLVYDYMDEVPAKAATDPSLVPDKNAIMVSVYDGQKMVYAKAPPAGFVFVHHYAGTEVVPDDPAKETALPAETGALDVKP